MIDFSTLKGVTIPEGNVTQISDASGRVLWKQAPSEAAVTITTEVTGMASAINANYVYVSIDGVKYTTATELVVPAGAAIHCFAYSGIQLNGADVGTYGQDPNSGTYAIIYDYTVTGNVAIKLYLNQPQGRPISYVYITEL